MCPFCTWKNHWEVSFLVIFTSISFLYLHQEKWNNLIIQINNLGIDHLISMLHKQAKVHAFVRQIFDSTPPSPPSFYLRLSNLTAYYMIPCRKVAGKGNKWWSSWCIKRIRMQSHNHDQSYSWDGLWGPWRNLTDHVSLVS